MALKWQHESSKPPNNRYYRDVWRLELKTCGISVSGPCEADPGYRIGHSGRKLFPDLASAQGRAVRNLKRTVRCIIQQAQRDLATLEAPCNAKP